MKKIVIAIVIASVLTMLFAGMTLAAGPSYSEADYALLAATGLDPATLTSVEDHVAKVQCATLTSDQCIQSYVTRTNALAKMLGIPFAVLVDVGDNVGQLTFSGKILNAIGRLEYP